MRKLREMQAFRHLNWNPGRRELRRFSLAMLMGFLLLGAIVAFRTGGIGTPALLLWGAGAVLAVLGLVPVTGRPAYLGVYVPSMLIGFVVSRVLLTVLYFGLFLPLGTALRLAGHNPLQLRTPGSSLWRDMTSSNNHSYYRQF